MYDRPAQFTIRSLALATFWMGECFGALVLADSGTAPGLLFMIAVCSLCAAVYVIFKNSPPAAPSRSRKSFLVSIVVWNALIWPLTLAYVHTLGPLVPVVYESLFGDIQASAAVFYRVAVYVWCATVTLPATAISLRVFDAMSHRSSNLRRGLLSIAIWEALALFVIAAADEVSLAWELNQFGWAIFGPLELYNFQNLVLHRIVAWLLATTPVVWTSLWVHSRLAGSNPNERG